MEQLKLIYRSFVGHVKKMRLPGSVALGAKQKRERGAWQRMEAERLDRIRNPSKYLGKGDADVFNGS